MKIYFKIFTKSVYLLTRNIETIEYKIIRSKFPNMMNPNIKPATFHQGDQGDVRLDTQFEVVLFPS